MIFVEVSAKDMLAPLRIPLRSKQNGWDVANDILKFMGRNLVYFDVIDDIFKFMDRKLLYFDSDFA